MQDILSQSFDVIQSDVALQKQVLYNCSLSRRDAFNAFANRADLDQAALVIAA